MGKFAYLLTMLALFFLVSCELLGRKDVSTELSVSIKKPKVSFESGSQFVEVKCDGDWTLALVQEDGEVDWASLNIMSGTGNKSNVRLQYNTNITGKERELSIILDNGLKFVSCSFTQVAGEYSSDSDATDDYQSSSLDLTKVSWLELPNMENPDLMYFSHGFKMDGKTYRNYSFGWSQGDRVAIWVAYPLCKFYTNGSAGRTNAWALDPLLGEKSSAPFSGYAGNYARGHQLPSADRQCCDAANAQTFYGTNMTPQLNGHNEGIWSELEGKVRIIANNSDTTYVVTGVVVTPSSGKETDSYGKSVTIPDAYFKALLRYSKSSTLGQWNAAAFYLEHRTYSEKLGKQHSMSIDRLEELTGIDFFINLPSKIGDSQAAKLEAADPANSAVWW